MEKRLNALTVNQWSKRDFLHRVARVCQESPNRRCSATGFCARGGMSWHEYDIYSKTYTEGSLFYNECPGIFTRTIVLIQTIMNWHQKDWRLPGMLLLRRFSNQCKNDGCDVVKIKMKCDKDMQRLAKWLESNHNEDAYAGNWCNREEEFKCSRK